MREENEISEQPSIAKSHDIRIDGDYAEWIAELKPRYRSAQVKVSVCVNVERLLFNWESRRNLVQKKAEERWAQEWWSKWALTSSVIFQMQMWS